MKAQDLLEKARKTLRIMGWTPSRYAKWKECSQKVLLEDLMKACPICFVGRISGGFDGEPVVCDTCSDPQPEREALDRGNRLDLALTKHMSGSGGPAVTEGITPQEESLAEATRHPVIKALVQKLRKTKGVSAQESIVLDARWQRVSQFTKNAWARLKLDVLHLTPKAAHVIDWKSGNIDKSKGEIRERPEYHDSMRAYQIAVLSAYPQPEATARMVFLDAPPKLAEPFKSLPVLKRSELAGAQKDWEKKVKPMLEDTIFAPRPGIYCRWCPFAKDKGGPCRF